MYDSVIVKLEQDRVTLQLRSFEKVLEVPECRHAPRRELLALLRALRALKRPCPVRLLGASAYLRGVLEQVLVWESRGYVRLKHTDLLRQLAG